MGTAVIGVPEWLRPFIWIFVWLSVIGLLVSLWVHVGAVMGRTVPSAFWVLHFGIFVVWFPAVLVAQRLVGNANRRDFWKAVLRDPPIGCATWCTFLPPTNLLTS
jgi:hypothetical protein